MRVSELPRRRVLVGDAAVTLRQLPPNSVDCVITSPPYFQLRNYGIKGQFGAEANIDEWVDNLVRVVDELVRVLKPTGSMWLNLGDSYSRHPRFGSSAKSLLLGPERLLLALSARGWICRNKVVWSKPNPMPTSVRDRLTCSWEPV
jgi:site-specific DNA-methyltransferase (adenine-specific)